jgi:hypothetical protein
MRIFPGIELNDHKPKHEERTMRKEMKFFGLSVLAGLLALGLANVPKSSGSGEVKLVFSSSTHGYFDPCG